MDIALAGLGLVLLLPVWILVSATIVATSGRPVLFAHRRCGRDGRGFRCLKFRTMVHGAESALDADDSLRSQFNERFKLHRDPRVTRIGRFLRLTSLDEVPQLVNVLRGEMSIVGPRPVTEAELHRMYGARGAEVLRVRPGVTGLWQVSGRSRLSYPERVRLDLEYVRRRSLTLDLQIMLRTVAVVITRDGAA